MMMSKERAGQSTAISDDIHGGVAGDEGSIGPARRTSNSGLSGLPRPEWKSDHG
jgi:hypothetical protein